MNLIHAYAPTVGLVFFFCFFVWMAVRTYHPRAKKQMNEHALIPLKEDQNG